MGLTRINFYLFECFVVWHLIELVLRTMKYVCLYPWGYLESYYLYPKDLILEGEVVMFMILLWVLVREHYSL